MFDVEALGDPVSMDEQQRRALPLRHWGFAGTDQEIAHEIYAVDAVLEFAQSDERFVGVENFKPLREKYPEPVESARCPSAAQGTLGWWRTSSATTAVRGNRR